jgi:drug/metabolite transporter (DMT)-like permease
MININKKFSSNYKLLILAGTFWGFSPILYKKSILIAGIIGLLLVRYFVGALLIYLAEHKKFTKIKRKSVALVLAFILFDGIIPIIAFTYGLSITSALHASVISLSFPFLVYFFTSIFLQEKIHRSVIIGSSVASFGLLLIIFTSSNGNNTSNLVGDLLLFLSQVFSAFGLVIAKKLMDKNKKIGPEQLVFLEYAGSFVVFAIAAMVLSININYNFNSLGSGLLVIATVLLGGAIPLLMYYRAAKKLPLERVADVHYISPTVGMIAAVVFLGDSITLALCVGVTLIIAGLLYSNNQLRLNYSFFHKLADVEKDILNMVVIEKKKAYEYVNSSNKD